MKTLIVMLSLLVSINLFAPNTNRVYTNYIEKVENQIQFQEDEATLDYNLVRLKDNIKRSRKEVFELVQPVIDVYLRRKNYHLQFPEISDSLSYALTCIFVSESSNRKGQPGCNSLWIYHNNPFGLTAKNGVTKTSWEMIKGERVVMQVTFREFNSFEEAIDSLMWDYLLKNRFSRSRSSLSVKDFLYNLYKDGYMTNHGWPKFAYNKLYLANTKVTTNTV